MTADDPVKAFGRLIPDQLFDALEAGYLKGTGKRCDGRFLALNSYENRVYQVGLDDDSRIVAKFYRPHRWSDSAILEEHRFTRQLADQEIPVIAPLADEDAQTLFSHGPFRYAVYPCRGGRALELDNANHLRQMGRFVARIHAAGAGERYQHRPDLDLHEYVAVPGQYLLENNFIPDHLVAAYQSLHKVLSDQIGWCHERSGGVKTIRLHGDFHPGNVLWADDSPHIVDFDDARNGPAVQDLWMFLSGDRQDMTAGLSVLLEGYTQFYDFNPAELHLVEALRTMRMIYHAGWLASRWQDPAFPLAFPWFDSLNYWESHIQNLREQSALMNDPPLEWIAPD